MLRNPKSFSSRWSFEVEEGERRAEENVMGNGDDGGGCHERGSSLGEALPGPYALKLRLRHLRSCRGLRG
ncbi:hypothetical protein COCNU_02G009980 [Cocos nucifera]|uniref:Uncharacterized protein n=1 Tax=Cocos nucifera TaxID=13894 RepID=A0A8K0HZG6_COCNU|nr:hypothetical protein COCNU_02G009980 [Cocos nucifera]